MLADALADGLALWPVAIPLAAAALTVLFRRRPALQRGIMEAAVALMLAAAALLLARVARGATVVLDFGGWGERDRDRPEGQPIGQRVSEHRSTAPPSDRRAARRSGSRRS